MKLLTCSQSVGNFYIFNEGGGIGLLFSWVFSAPFEIEMFLPNLMSYISGSRSDGIWVQTPPFSDLREDGEARQVNKRDGTDFE